MTIKDISVLTGYSVGTVSRVLNDQPNVSEKARKAILEAARAHGFQLNANAKQLKQQRTNTILVIVQGISNELFGKLLEAIQALVSTLPYPLVVDYVDEEDNAVLRGAQLCREKKPQGILFLGANMETFQTSFQGVDVPCVLVTGDASWLALPNLSSVTTDDRQAGFLAIEHLAKLGHKRIALIGSVPNDKDLTGLRFAGCMEAFAAYGLPFDPETDFAACRFSYADGHRAMEALLEKDRGYTAVFAMADVLAIGAIRALWDHGLRVPEDVSVIGLDGLAIGEYTVPKLTTIRQSVRELAEKSVELLRRQMEGAQSSRHISIAPRVERKESTAAREC